MTKDEIKQDEFCDTMFQKLQPTEMKFIDDAMDVYAKQEAIWFDEWEHSQGYQYRNGKYFFPGNPFDISGNIIFWTTEQLYTIYQQQKDENRKG
jgi:hypothetical protein